MEKREKIVIGKPYRQDDETNAYLKSNIRFPDGEEKTVFFSVPLQDGAALAVELADCFVVASFQWCMRKSYDIESEAPVSRSLLYSMNKRLIPGMCRESKIYHQINIFAEASDLKYESADYVGLCWSGGCDSFYSYMANLKAPEGCKVTHFMNMNAGVFLEPDIDGQFKESSEKCMREAKAFGLQALCINTNIHLVFYAFYMTVCPEMLTSCMLAVQKSFHMGLISTTGDIRYMSYDDNIASLCMPVLIDCLSTQNITICAPGGEVSRIEKIRQLSDFEPAHKMLHVCVKEINKNCMKCGKCDRTLAALDALGTLDRFGESFDLKYFEKHRDEIWGRVLHDRNRIHCAEPLAALEKSGRKPSKRAQMIARMLDAALKAANTHESEIMGGPVGPVVGRER